MRRGSGGNFEINNRFERQTTDRSHVVGMFSYSDDQRSEKKLDVVLARPDILVVGN